jgi:hypothetical protein
VAVFCQTTVISRFFRVWLNNLIKKQMNLTAQNVSETFMNCLFKEGENTENHIVAEGVMTKVGFHPERLKEATPQIEAMVNELPDEFKPTGGGGMSFLNACMDNKGNHWAEHSTIDQLVCLGIASGKLKYLMPREMWSVLPGGMPYLVVS